MSPDVCGLAADTKVETPEGAMAIRAVAGKAIAVFTREQGRVRFRLMQNVRKVAEQQPVLRITLENGHSFRVAPYQVLFKKGMVECPASALEPGDALEPAFTYPEGHRFRDDADGGERDSDASLRIGAVAAGGTADVYTLGVNQTGCFFLTAGVLCKAAAG
jgi:phage terminase large subunit-like protein